VTPYYTDDAVTLWHGDCLEVLRDLPDASIDAVVTDPPYGLEFMGKEWDAPWRDSAAKFREPTEADEGFRVTRGSLPDAYRAGAPFQAWCEQWATECLRVLKPGGHLLAFGGTRTSHRLACAIEDAGFEIRDSIMWIYASGFPKSHNVTKALDHLVPADARCACAQRSTRTAQDSQGGYPSSHGSGDARPRPGEGSARSSAPSRADAPERTHAGRRAGGPASAPANTSPGGASDRPSIGRSAPLGSQSEPSRDGEHESSDTRTSTSVVPGREHRRTPDRTPYTSGSAAGSASAYAPHQYMACPDCGKVRVPQGLGTALKPAFEPVVVARKPLAGTVAANVLAHGTGALNIDGCRIGDEERWNPSAATNGESAPVLTTGPEASGRPPVGRWPANVILDESQAAELDRQSGVSTSVQSVRVRAGQVLGNGETHGAFVAAHDNVGGFDDTGGASRFFLTTKGDDQWNPERANTAEPTSSPRSASGDSAPGDVATSESLDTARQTASPTSRFIYCAKAPTTERPRVKVEGAGEGRIFAGTVKQCPECGCKTIRSGAGGLPSCGHGKFENVPVKGRGEHVAHPTVKPLDLMRWLVRLVTPPGGVVLDPFVGSGTTAEACVIEGFRCIAVEREADYLPLIVQRLTKPIQPDLFGGAA